MQCTIGFIAQHCLSVDGGPVVAVFDSSAYLQSRHGLFCVGDYSLPAGPINVALPIHELRLPPKASSWSNQNGFLLLDNHLFSALQPTTIWYPPRKGFQTEQLPQLQINVRHATSLLSTLAARPTAEALETRISKAITALKSSLYPTRQPRQQAATTTAAGTEPTPAAIRQLLGCGPGLTPAGDDFLVGYLVTLQQMAQQSPARRLAAWIEQSGAHLTSAISNAHLQAATRGAASEPLHQFIEVLHQPDRTKLQNNAQRLCAIGESSGTYSMRGALLAATHVANSLYCQKNKG